MPKIYFLEMMKMTTQQNNIQKLRKRINGEHAKTLLKMIHVWEMLGAHHRYDFSAAILIKRMNITKKAAEKLVEMGMDTGILDNNHGASYGFTRTMLMMRHEMEALNDN